MVEPGQLVIPGQRLASSADHRAGKGTHVRGAHVYASLVGNFRRVSSSSSPPSTTTSSSSTGTGGEEFFTCEVWCQQQHFFFFFKTRENGKWLRLLLCAGLALVLDVCRRSPFLYICSLLPPQVHCPNAAPRLVPTVGSIVTGKITHITPTWAKMDIVCLGDQVLASPFKGMIRKIDVRAHEVDKVEIYDCFRPGDVVRAEVLSLGDSRSYFLSTAKNALGVISAKSVVGAKLVPVSWQHMMCPLTKAKERRKVAKTV